jgi:hypothetical protein
MEGIMNYLDYAAEAFILIPLAAIILNNICPKKFIEDNFHILTGAVAVIQMAAAIAVLYFMDVEKLQNYNFFVLWKTNASNAEFFSLNPISPIFLFCIGMVVFVSVMIAIKTIDTKKISYVIF